MKQRAPVVCIDPVAIADQLAGTVSPSEPVDRYGRACALAQVWCDTLLLAEASRQPLGIRRRARLGAGLAAEAALAAAFDLAGKTPPSKASVIQAKQKPVTDTVIRLYGNIGPWLDILQRVLLMPMPECYGYDLGDPAQAIDDAQKFARHSAPGQRMVVVGIRGGGMYLAPGWAAGLTLARGTIVPWMTVRPLRTVGHRAGYHAAELAVFTSVCRRLTQRPDVVIVDDRPDSWETVTSLAQALAPQANAVWFACIGQSYRMKEAGHWEIDHALAPRWPRQPSPALWQLLLPNDHASFLHRLASVLPSGLVQDAAEIRIRCPSLEKQYGRQSAWLPWNHPELQYPTRRLVNPKKTPLVVLDHAGHPLLHLRFVGEGPFGCAEFQRAQNLIAGQRQAWFADGYRIEAHIAGLRPLREVLAQSSASERHSLLLRCLHALRAAEGRPLARIIGQPATLKVGEKLCFGLDRLGARLGQAIGLPPSLGWLAEASTPAYGAGGGRPFRSSLRYAHGHWHWQVAPDGTVHHFHLEATWGDISWPALEQAVFLLEHPLPPTLFAPWEASNPLSRSQLAAVVAALPAAAALRVDSWLRELRQFTPAGKDRLLADLDTLWSMLAHYTELAVADRRRGKPI